MINRDISIRLAAGRGRLVTQLADAAASWGGQVPEDPGITELADLLEAAANGVPARPGDPGPNPRTPWPVPWKTCGRPPGSAACSPQSRCGTCNAP
ncbi:hypothetical protein ACFQ2K_51360 [Streptomyces sanglieri]|uniref:Uncharacterized protein n=1 Tax=Streptomyces sanglieri TaxID=193460 RepID=A0ABW2X9R8_9ACTN